MIKGRVIKRIESFITATVIASFSFAQTTIVLQPGKIKPAVFTNFKPDNNKITITLPPFSVLVLELKR